LPRSPPYSVFTLWVGRRLQGAFVLHGFLIALVAMSLFLLVLGLTAGSINQQSCTGLPTG
jgi:hypothetical protein